MRVVRRVSRGDAVVRALDRSGAGRERVDEEVSKGTPARMLPSSPRG